MEDDQISQLPDCVLGSIVSFLPPKAAARTIVLSRRWRHIWPSLPLDLNLESPNSDIRFLRAGSILSILSSHRGPIRRFCVITRAGIGTRAWLQALAERHIDDTLSLKWATDLEQPFLPRSLLGSAGVTLRYLDLHCCCLGIAEDPRPPVPPLPRLDFLRLSKVLISEAALHGMIQCSSVLRELHLIMIDGLRYIKFCSSTLTTMHISTPLVPLEEFSDQGTPNLERVTFSYIDIWRVPAFTINSAKKLREIGLKLPTLDSPRLCLVTNKMPLPFVTYLVFGMKFDDVEELKRAIHILSLFPCLQRLEIWAVPSARAPVLCGVWGRVSAAGLTPACAMRGDRGSNPGPVGYRRYALPLHQARPSFFICFNVGSKNRDGFGQWDPTGEIVTCLNKHLTHVLFKGYCGTAGEVEFARFLMARSKLLNSMEMNHSVGWSQDGINCQKESIYNGGQASMLAQIHFTKSNDLDNVRGELARYLYSVPLI